MPRAVTFIATESRWQLSELGLRGRESVFNGDRVSALQDEKILEILAAQQGECS